MNDGALATWWWNTLWVTVVAIGLHAEEWDYIPPGGAS